MHAPVRIVYPVQWEPLQTSRAYPLANSALKEPSSSEADPVIATLVQAGNIRMKLEKEIVKFVGQGNTPSSIMVVHCAPLAVPQVLILKKILRRNPWCTRANSTGVHSSILIQDTITLGCMEYQKKIKTLVSF